jgi:hypothetical protein
MNDEPLEWTAGDLRRFLDGLPEATVVRIVTNRSRPVEEAIGGVAFSEDLYLDPEPQPGDDVAVYIVADGLRDSGPSVDLSRAWDAMWINRR